MRNKVTSRTRLERKNEIASEIEKDPSSKNIWKIINNQITKKASSNNVKISEDGKDIESQQETAEIFNHHFKNKIQGLRDKINEDYKKDPFSKMSQKMHGKKGIRFYLKTVSEGKVIKIIKSIKSKHSCGFDGISADMLKKCAEVVAIPLTRIINSSIISGTFPEYWKLAVVKPLFKKGKKSDKSNYRPISLLSAPSMILERVVREQMVNYMETNNLFSENQFGFRARKSTVGAMLSMHSTCVSNAEDGNVSAMAFYDLSAAFDTLDSGILCGKLQKYGFNDLAVKWIQSYLSNRRQQVVIEDSKSSVINLPYGSPQGSCLSPSLFIILISDVDLWLEKSEVIGYCDDTSTVTRGKTEKEAADGLKKDSTNMMEFCASNHLVINPSKTCVMFNGKDCKLRSVLIGDQEVKVEQSGKLLGVEFSNDLTWNAHVEELKNTLNQRLSLIKRLKETLGSQQLISVGEALVNSKIRYALACYSTIQQTSQETKSSLMQRLQMFQNSLMRIIFGYKKTDHVSIECLLKKTGYLSVNRMAVYHTLQEAFSIIKEDSIPSLSSKFLPARNEHHNTRLNEKNRLRLPMCKSKRNEGFLYKSVKLWNSLPAGLKCLDEKRTFMSQMKKWVKENIPI